MANVIHSNSLDYAFDYEDHRFDDYGAPITRDMVGDAYDPSLGDVLSSDLRVAGWDYAARHRHEMLRWRHLNNQGLPHVFGAVFYSGEIRAGKSLVMAARSRRYWISGGMSLSTDGNLFGRRLSYDEALEIFEEEGLSHFMLDVDEVHALLDRRAGAAWVNRLNRNGAAMFGKTRARGQYASAREWDVSLDVLAACDYWIYPERYYVQSAKFPPWCYIRTYRIKEPMRRPRKIDEFRPERPSRGIIPDEPMSPWMLYETAKLMDTWQRPAIAAALELTADEIRKRRKARADGERQAETSVDLIEALKQAVLAGNLDPKRRAAIPVNAVHIWASEQGYAGSISETREILKGKDALNSMYRVPVPNLLDMVGLRPKEQEE